MPLRSLLIACLFALPIAASPPPQDAQLVDRFVALLERDDMTALHELAPDSVDPMVAWRSATYVVERLDCIEIESATFELLTDVAAEERLLRVTIRGTGVIAGAVRDVDTLPNVWFLRAVPVGNDWRLAEVETAEQRLATALIAAASDDERRSLLDMDVDLSRVGLVMAYDSVDLNLRPGALDAIRFGRELAAAAGDRMVVVQTRQFESSVYSILHCGDEAVQTAMEAVDESLAIGDADTLSAAWFAAAYAQWGNNDIPSAIDYFHRSAALAHSMINPRNAARAWVNIAYLENERGNVRRAIEAANEMAKLSRETGWIQGQIDALNMRMGNEGRLGNRAASRQTGHEAYELALKLGDRGKIMQTSINLGMEAVDLDPDEAIGYLEPWIDDPFAGTLARIKIADALVKKGRIAEGIAGYEQAAAIAESKQQFERAAIAKIQLSRLIQHQNPQRALDLVRSARQHPLDSVANNTIRPWNLEAAEASALFALGRTAEAEQLYEKVVNEYQAERDSANLAESTHTDFYGAALGIFHDLIALKLLRGQKADAIRLSELVKASQLDEIQSGERVDVGSRFTPEERAEQQKIEEEITRLNRELFAAARDEKRAAALKKTLTETRTRWESLETSLHSIHAIEHPHTSADPLQPIDTLVPDAHSLVLDYVVTESKTILFVLSRDARGELRIDTHTIDISLADLQRAVDRFLGRLADASFDYENDARRLYRLLLAPASKSLDGKTVIAVVPDGPLWRLPFQAMQRGDGQPLIAQCTLFYTPSLTSLHHVPKPESQRPAVLAIGNPRFDRGAAETLRARTRAVLGDLPEAAMEAREIAGLYGGERSRALVGREATEGAIKEQAPAYDIVHIAAHAVVDDAQPLYSSIVLASDGSNDGLLEGREITRLHLHARLAVLSACSTAQGQVRPGEGMIALSWAFLIAGCPTVVATQWNVPTESTARLMIDFHRALARGATVAAALRQAQLNLMKDRRYRHPFYWSPFVVVGAGRS